MPALHRVIGLVCVLGAGIAPISSALLCRVISRLAVKLVIPHSGNEPLPQLTQVWIVNVASGHLPLIPTALFISVLVVTSGFYLIFSRRPAPPGSNEYPAYRLLLRLFVCDQFDGVHHAGSGNAISETDSRVTYAGRPRSRSVRRLKQPAAALFPDRHPSP